MNSLLPNNLVMHVKVLRESQECRNFYFSNTFFYETSISREIIYAKRLITKIALE